MKGIGNLCVAVTRAGDRLAFQASGGLTLRDGNGVEIAHLKLPGRIVSHGFDRQGARLAAGTTDGLVRVWDRDGHWLFDLPNQGGAMFVEFSEDGRRLATVTTVMARLYTTDVDELEALAAARSTRTFSELERARFADILAPVR